MTDYPKLDEMGISHPDQIEDFAIYGMETYDVLNITYKRRKGSLLPVSRTYKFLRAQNKFKTKDGKTERRLVTNPELRAAHDELQKLCEMKNRKKTTTEAILEQLRLLEDDIALRSACIRELAGRI